jgi:high-affinity Fe2+/Pb2+ permease
VGTLLGWLIGVGGAGDSYGDQIAISGFTLLGSLVGLLVGLYWYRRYSRRQ